MRNLPIKWSGGISLSNMRLTSQQLKKLVGAVGSRFDELC